MATGADNKRPDQLGLPIEIERHAEPLRRPEPVRRERRPRGASPLAPPPRRLRVTPLELAATLPPVCDGLVMRVCHGHTCGKRSAEIEHAIADEVKSKGLEGTVGLESYSCFGKCFMGPNLLVERWQDGARDDSQMVKLMIGVPTPALRYEHHVQVEDVPKMIRWHLRSWRKDRDS